MESPVGFQGKEFVGLKSVFDMGRQIIRSLRLTIKCVGNLSKTHGKSWLLWDWMKLCSKEALKTNEASINSVRSNNRKKKKSELYVEAKNQIIKLIMWHSMFICLMWDASTFLTYFFFPLILLLAILGSFFFLKEWLADTVWRVWFLQPFVKCVSLRLQHGRSW